jgi:hypothetical protein
MSRAMKARRRRMARERWRVQQAHPDDWSADLDPEAVAIERATEPRRDER